MGQTVAQLQSVNVLTSAIELEGIRLGAFKISLNWPRIGQGNAYECQALEPCRPGDHDGVTHPHVLDNHLCEGEGAAPIKAALTTGRVYDFFVLARQILTTYNPASAHVPLDDWNGGMSCHGCGSRIDEDDYCCCDACDERFCNECSWMCNDCDRPICTDCSCICALCSQRYCDGCVSVDESTKQLVCNKCQEARKFKNPNKDLSDEACKQTPAKQPADLAAAPEPVPTAAVDSLRLG
jgi:hypothetical protein